MSMRTEFGEKHRPLVKHPAILIAATGLALGLSANANAVSRIRSYILPANSLISSTSGQGSTVVVGNIEGGHIWPTHETVEDRVVRIWFNANDVGVNAGQARGMFYSAHATAAASAIAGEDFSIPNTFPKNIKGFAPDAPVILSAGFATGRNQFGVLTGVTDTAVAFAIFALVDPTIATYAASHLSIDPYPVASVVNASFGVVGSTNERRGESIVAHAFDAAAWHTDATIVVAAGDFNNDPVLEELMTLPGYQGGTVGTPGSAFNVLTVGRLAQTNQNTAEESSEGPVGIVDWRKAGVTMISSITPAVFQAPCTNPQTLPNETPEVRSAIHLAAPGTMLTLAGSPILDPPDDFPMQNSDTAFFTLWEGTSFASAITAGIAALTHDLGNKSDIWLADEDGVKRPSGLVTRAVMINSAARGNNFPDPSPMEANLMGPEGEACIFIEPFDEAVGAGVVNPREIRPQLIGNQARDILPDGSRPYIVDGFERFLVGFERSTYAPTDEDPADMFREPPPLFDPIALFVEAGGPPDQGTVETMPNFFEQLGDSWYTGWESPNVVLGTDPNRPFVTTVETNIDSGLGVVAQTDEAPVDSVTPIDATDLPAPTPAPHKSREGLSGYRELGQPGLVFPDDPNLDNGGRGGIFTNAPGAAPPSGLGTDGGGGGDNDLGGAGFIRRYGWDHGRMGVGFIDYPIGFMTADSVIRATLVWNRTEIWRESDLNSWASTNAFDTVDMGKITPFIRTLHPGTVPQPNLSEDGFELPTFQRAFAMENLDLEIWRRNAGGQADVLVGSSRSEWGTVEHLSVGPTAEGGLCDPDFGMLFGNYYIRVKYVDTMFDLGGYRYCGDFQSLQMMHAATNLPYENLYPGEVEFAVAWSSLSPSQPGVFNGLHSGAVAPVDMDGNGSIDEGDIQLMVQSVMGDLDTDGVINSTDLSILLSKFGSGELRYDLNFDGAVDGSDLAFLLARFGPTPMP